MNIADPDGMEERSPAKPEGSAAEPETTEDGKAGRKPAFPLRKIVRLTLVVLGIILLLRIFVFSPYAIPTGSMYPTIMQGDVVLINKLPYYIRTPDRLPFTNIAIPHLTLPGPGTLERGDVVVFVAPRMRRSYEGTDRLVKRCVALPGDTLRLINGLIEVNGKEPPLPADNENEEEPRLREPINPDRAFEPLRNNRRVIVPYKGYDLLLQDSATAEAWKSVIEAEGVSVEYRNSIVFLSGRPATFYRFQHDYFFALGDQSSDSYDSRFFGFIPCRNLIGQVLFVYWSRDPDDGIRWGRLGTIVE